MGSGEATGSVKKFVIGCSIDSVVEPGRDGISVTRGRCAFGTLLLSDVRR